jgi:hypothetical protein
MRLRRLHTERGIIHHAHTQILTEPIASYYFGRCFCQRVARIVK